MEGKNIPSFSLFGEDYITGKILKQVNTKHSPYKGTKRHAYVIWNCLPHHGGIEVIDETRLL